MCTAGHLLSLSLSLSASGYRGAPEDIIRNSPAFVSQQASLAFYQKEHSAFAATVQQLTAELNNTVDNQKMEREKFRVWRKDFERSSRDSISSLKKELSMVRKGEQLDRELTP